MSKMYDFEKLKERKFINDGIYDKIYKYKFVNEKGEIEEVTKNVYDMIQQVNYMDSENVIDPQYEDVMELQENYERLGSNIYEEFNYMDNRQDNLVIRNPEREETSQEDTENELSNTEDFRLDGGQGGQG